LQDLTQDSVQAKGILTYLLNAAGHHVIKLGVDASWATYKVNTTYSGGSQYRTLAAPAANPNGSLPTSPTLQVFDFRRYGIQSDIDVISDEPQVNKTVKSTIIGGFVQDSWSIMDKVTVNLGLRYDSLTLKNDVGVTGMALNDQWSPRIGVVWDPTQ